MQSRARRAGYGPIHLLLRDLLLLAALLALAGGCAYEGWTPGAQPSDLGKVNLAPAEQLPLDTPVQGELDCSVQNCVDNFRINVPGSGRVTVEARRTSAARSGELLQLLLKSPEQRILVDQVAPGTEVATAEHGVEGPARYFVALQVGGGRSEYEIVARYTPIMTVLEPKPQPEAAGVVQGPPSQQDRRMQQKESRVSARLGGGEIHDPRFNFLPLRTFAFLQRPEEAFEDATEGGAMLGNPFVIKEAQRAVRTALLNRGFDLASQQDAEFLVSIGGGSRSVTGYVFNQQSVRENYGNYYSAWGYIVPSMTPASAERGTLIIDFVSPYSGKLVWHGWATIPIDPNKDLNQLIRQAVREILDRFPPS